jgi:RHS repeat-associated protein
VTQDVIKDIDYLPFGPARAYTFGNNLQRDLTYDESYRLTNISTPGIQGLAYAYDSRNNITSITNQVRMADTQNFGYDNQGRLTSISSFGVGNSQFTYDALGNRLTRSGSQSESYSIDASSNRLNSVTRGGSSRTFTYDANGNVVSENGFNGQTRSYQYNDDNRMISADSAVYAYNALGQRVRRQANGLTRHFIYAPSGELLARSDYRQYIYFEGQVVGYIKSNQLYFVHNDHLGRPEVLTNSAGNPVWRAQLEAFGRTVLFSNIGDFNIGFPGQYWDEEKQSWYNYYRDYDATTGRYLQSDPIGLGGGMNSFTYALNTPVSLIDRLGLSVELCASSLVDGSDKSPASFNPARHDYLVVDGKAYGFAPKSLSSDTLFGEGYIRATDNVNNKKCETLVADSSKDKAVIDAINKVGEPQYAIAAGDYPLRVSDHLVSLGFRNCQSWVQDVLNEAGIR